jgi:penicillin-binding protein 1A
METNSKFKRPSGIVSSKVVIGSNPPALPNSTTPSSKIQTHLFIKGTQPKKVSTQYYYKEPTTTENDKEIVEDLVQ